MIIVNKIIKKYNQRLKNMKKLRVLHARENPAGYSSGLVDAERRIGIDSTIVTYRPHAFAHSSDINLNLSYPLGFKDMVKVAGFLLRALKDYDVFHFDFGTSFLTFRSKGIYELDLPLYKLFKKKVFVTYNGCDARQKDIFSSKFEICPCRNPNCNPGVTAPDGSGATYRVEQICDSKEDVIRRMRIKKFSKYANKIFAATPDLLNVLPEGSEFLPQVIPGFDDLVKRPIRYPKYKKIRIAHAPTNQIIKGTEYILGATKAIMKERSDIEFILVEGKSYSEVRQIIASCDLVIDQLLVGWYGTLAIEAMALGIPVICYIRDVDLGKVANEDKLEIPIVNACPSSLKQVLSDLLSSPTRLKSLGEQSREYVLKWHNPFKIAEYLKSIYES